MQSRLFFFALILCTALPVSAQAQYEERFDSGWYVGGGLSLNEVFSYESYCFGCYGSSTYGDGDSGFTITGGLRVNEYLAVEGSYYGESTMRWNEGVVVFLNDPFGSYLLDADIELSSWQISVVGILAGRKWEGSLRLGLALWSARSDEVLTSLSDGSQLVGSFDHDGEDLVVGIGVGRSVGENMQIRMLGVGGSESANADSLSLQILWRFGTRGE
jgi:hypothetical protein